MNRLNPQASEKSRLKEKSRVHSFDGLMIIGWREWVNLPDLGIGSIKAKIDTGARTSALHAYEIEEYTLNKKNWVNFKVHPLQRDNRIVTKAKAVVIDKRYVKNSGGKITLRPVIMTTVVVGHLSWDIELTLIDRSDMGFRMLLGREAVRGHLLVHPGKSYLLGAQSSKKGKKEIK